MSPEITKIIEQYLQNELSEADRAAFEQKLKESDTLLNEVVLQRRVHEAAKRASVRTLVKQTAKRYHFRKQLTTAAAVVIAASAIAAATWFVVKRGAQTEAITDETALLSLIEQLDDSAPIEGLEAEYFNLSKKDTVVLSRYGILLSIPEGAFSLDGKVYSGPKVVQWQEAMGAADVIKGGLSTMAGDKLLETQGMFGLQAFTPEGKQLDVNPKVGVYVQVPVDELKEGMMLFEGKKGKNGVVDWQNPQPLEKLPVMADMRDLDFYPPGYEDELDRLKWKTAKKYRDSLYLSMEPDAVVTDEPFSYTWNTAEPARASAWPKDQAGSVIHSTQNLSRYEVGKQLFEQKCATCHSPHRDGTGPRLYGARAKWASGGAKPGSIYQWVQNWKAAAATDPFAAQVARMKPTDQPLFKDLRKDDIDAIFDYIDGESIYDESNRGGDAPTAYTFIPPSKVLAFWNPKFNNTILATRDFEKRMKSIHNTCSEKVLEEYTGNLDKPLHEIDARVFKMGYSEFWDFAAERVGAVQPNNPHTKNLQQFYTRAVAQLKERARNDRDFARKLERDWDEKVSRSREQESNRTAQRESSALQEEQDYNMKSVLKQLGTKKTIGMTIRSGGKVVETTSEAASVNVYNVDRFVAETTQARATGVFTDPETGKTATLTYNAFSVSVENSDKYGKLMLYLFPREFNSYQRIDPVDGKFTYSLNDGLTYDIAVVAVGEKGYYIYENYAVKKGDLGAVVPEKVSEAAFSERIRTLHSRYARSSMPVTAELDWLIKEQRNYTVQRLRIENTAFRNRIRKIVFPCSQYEVSGEEYGVALQAVDSTQAIPLR